MFTPRSRKVKILATLGPASSDPEMIRKLLLAGADAFRINMSHGNHAQKAKIVERIRALEKDLRRPTTILFDAKGHPLLLFEDAWGLRWVLERETAVTFHEVAP